MDTAQAGSPPAVVYFDGNWIDCASLMGGVGYALYKCYKASPRRKVISKETGLDIANGVSLVPLAILSLTIFSNPLLEALFRSNKLILSVAGLVALLSMLES